MVCTGTRLAPLACHLIGTVIASSGGEEGGSEAVRGRRPDEIPRLFGLVWTDSHITDFIQNDGSVSQPYNEDGPAEAPSIAPYVGRWGDGRELRESYSLAGDELVLRPASTEVSSGARLYIRTSR